MVFPAGEVLVLRDLLELVDVDRRHPAHLHLELAPREEREGAEGNHTQQSLTQSAHLRRTLLQPCAYLLANEDGSLLPGDNALAAARHKVQRLAAHRAHFPRPPLRQPLLLRRRPLGVLEVGAERIIDHRDVRNRAHLPHHRLPDQGWEVELDGRVGPQARAHELAQEAECLEVGGRLHAWVRHPLVLVSPGGVALVGAGQQQLQPVRVRALQLLRNLGDGIAEQTPVVRAPLAHKRHLPRHRVAAPVGQRDERGARGQALQLHEHRAIPASPLRCVRPPVEVDDGDAAGGLLAALEGLAQELGLDFGEDEALA
mmetsp:Transcript_7770/g.15401  ORF Transcript_7770/g.15401 Transcript_7770/m.15401 type:complete len:314 (+) Transcript_7770:606-1547(+)